MDYEKYLKIVGVRAKNGSPFRIRVRGTSMMPILNDGDIVTIQKSDIYSAGDILLYPFENEGLLLHRLLKINGSRYYCKGDNTFRIEEVMSNGIFGKVISVTRKSVTFCLPTVSAEFLEMSYSVYWEFIKHDNSVRKTKLTEVYKNYKQKFLV